MFNVNGKQMKAKVGDHIRSYDFEGVDHCYVEGIVLIGDGYSVDGCPACRPAVPAPDTVEQMVRSLSAWEQVWEGIRDNHEPNLNPTNKPLAVAATFQLAISRAEQLERERDHWREQAELADDTLTSRDRNIADILAESQRRLERAERAERELIAANAALFQVQEAAKVLLAKGEMLAAVVQGAKEDFVRVPYGASHEDVAAINDWHRMADEALKEWK